MVECEDPAVHKMYAKVTYDYFNALMEVQGGHIRRGELREQGTLIQKLSQVSTEIRSMKEARAKKIERLRAVLADPKGQLHSFPALPLPLDPTKKVCGIIPEKSGVFNSNLQPLRITFVCEDKSEYPIIFKTGDDLRQDQLVIQIILLMDKLMQKENLDLKLTPYKVLATGSEHGLMQFIPSMSLAGVLNEHQNNLLSFFRQHHPSSEPGNVYGIDPRVMETYIRSCGKTMGVIY